jgi:hypothetical protein
MRLASAIFGAMIATTAISVRAEDGALSWFVSS